MVKVDCMIRSVCYSPDFNHIAIGLGGEPDERRGEKTVEGSIGQFKILERKVAEDGTMSLEVVFEERHSKQTIYDIKYSPDGESLAVAAGDNIYFYDVEQQYKHTKTFKKHKMPITHFDFSMESDFIISNCQGGDVFFADAHTGGHIPSPAELKDVDWSTWTVCNGWASMGVHTPYKDGSVVHAVARSHDRNLLAVATSHGIVRVHRYPCYEFNSVGLEYRGHSADIRNLAWTQKDEFLLTAGGGDKCIMQWRRRDDPGDGESENFVLRDADRTIVDSMIGCRFEAPAASGPAFDLPMPWVGEVEGGAGQSPAGAGGTPGVLASHRLRLEHVYGYSSQRSRHNLFYSYRDDIVYHAAAVGIIYNKPTHSQSFFTEHTDDITCIAVDKTGRFAVTAQRVREGVENETTVRVWSVGNGAQLCSLHRVHRGTVNAVSFSECGKKIAVVGDHYGQSLLAVYVDGAAGGTGSQAPVKGGSDWKSSILVAEKITGPQLEYAIQWYPDGEDASRSAAGGGTLGDYALATLGDMHIFFWTIGDGGVLSQHYGHFGKVARRQHQTTSAIVSGTLVTGTVSGELLRWEGKKCADAVAAHTKMVTSMHAMVDKLVTGSMDGKVKVWDGALQCLREFDVQRECLECIDPHVRAVCFDNKLTKILVGTASSEIYEVCFRSGSFTLLQEGHCKHELWGLGIHPSDPNTFATSGDDSYTRVYSIKHRKVVKKSNMDIAVRAVAFSSSDRNLMAIGTGGTADKANLIDSGGGFVVIDCDNMDVMHEGRDSKEWWVFALHLPPNPK